MPIIAVHIPPSSIKAVTTPSKTVPDPRHWWGHGSISDPVEELQLPPTVERVPHGEISTRKISSINPHPVLGVWTTSRDIGLDQVVLCLRSYRSHAISCICTNLEGSQPFHAKCKIGWELSFEIDFSFDVSNVVKTQNGRRVGVAGLGR